MLKNSNFFGRDSYNIINFFYKILFKNMNFTYEFTLREVLTNVSGALVNKTFTLKESKVKTINFWEL